jgi:hypothetical protein
MRENRQYGFVPKSGSNYGRCIGGSSDGTTGSYKFHPLRTVHGVSYGFWYPAEGGKTPLDIIIQLAMNYRAPRKIKS